MLFVLIIGYFLQFQHGYSVKDKVLQIWKEVIFYSLLIFAVVMIFLVIRFTWRVYKKYFSYSV